MKTTYIKSLFIVTILIFSINSCNSKNTSSDTIDTERIEERIDSRHIVESSGARGWQYFWRGDYESSLEMLYLLLELVESQDLPQIANYYSSLGLLHSRLGNHEQSEFYFNRALKITQTGNDIPARLRALRNFVALHASRGDMKQFETTMDMKAAIRDSLLIKKHEAEQRANELLVQKNRYVQFKRNIIVFLTIIVVLITTLSVITILFYRNKKREATTAVRHYEEILKLKKEAQPHHTEGEAADEKVDELKQLAFEIQHLFETEKIYRQQGLTVDDVAKRLQISPRQLSNTISEHYQKNFMEYVNTFRIEEAIEMLKQQNKGEKYTNYTIQAIGETVGFTNRSPFYAAFKKIVGVAPSEYIDNINKTESSEIEIENAEQ